MITPYVVGFLFPSSEDHVLLIRKRRPSWQAGLLNGIGGKIEPAETPIAAMVREFHEEAGIELATWENCAVHRGASFHLHVFAAFNDSAFACAQAVTDENLERFPRHEFYRRQDVISNLKLHVTIALDRSGLRRPVYLFDFDAPAAA